MAGTAVLSTIKHDVSGAAPTFRDGSGNEIGQLVKSWVNFNGSGGASARASFNVSSLTRNTTGDYSVTLTNAQIDANYAAVCVGGAGSSAAQTLMYASAYNVTVAPTTTVYRFVQANAYSGTQYDVTYINSVVLR